MASGSPVGVSVEVTGLAARAFSATVAVYAGLTIPEVQRLNYLGDPAALLSFLPTSKKTKNVFVSAARLFQCVCQDHLRQGEKIQVCVCVCACVCNYALCVGIGR